MRKEIIDHVKNLKDQGTDVKVDEDQIDDLINKIFDEKYEKYKTYIESELDKFLKDYVDKNINISYGDIGNKNKFDTEDITRSLKKLRKKFINFDEFKEEYNKFAHNVTELKEYKYENKKKFSINQKKLERYDRDFKNIVDLYDIYNLKSDSDTSIESKGLKILTNKQMLNHLPILLAQIEAGNNSKSLKNEIRQMLYSLYRSKVLTKTTYNNLIKSIRSK